MIRWQKDPVPIGDNPRFSTNLARLALACFAIFAVLLLPINKANGQTQAAAATLSGTVTDTTGAVIPDATVTVVNTDQRFQRQEKTNGTGLYMFTLLPPGQYSLTVQKQGLSAYTQTNINLQVGQSLEIPVADRKSVV